jgi:hypothetical protein
MPRHERTCPYYDQHLQSLLAEAINATETGFSAERRIESPAVGSTRIPRGLLALGGTHGRCTRPRAPTDQNYRYPVYCGSSGNLPTVRMAPSYCGHILHRGKPSIYSDISRIGAWCISSFALPLTGMLDTRCRPARHKRWYMQDRAPLPYCRREIYQGEMCHNTVLAAPYRRRNPSREGLSVSILPQPGRRSTLSHT